VAKPYGNRQAGMYEIAQIFMALLRCRPEPKSGGCPLASWAESRSGGDVSWPPVRPQRKPWRSVHDTDPAIAINWMMLDGGGSQWYIGKVYEAGGS